MWCNNKEEAKAAIRANKMVDGNRQIGKTEAILEVVHEDHGGKAIIICPTVQLANITKMKYRRLYPGDETATTFCNSDPKNVLYAIHGHVAPVYVDSYGLVPIGWQEQIAEILRGQIVGAW